MKKIKIAHILHCVGGVEVSLRLITKNINPDKYENIIIHGLKDTNAIFSDRNDQELKSYKLPIYREIALLSDLKSIYATYKIIKKERPDVIHVHSAKGGIIGRVIGKFFKIKVLFTPQAFSFLSEKKGVKRFVFLKIEQFFANGNSILLASSNSEKQRGIDEVGYQKEKVLLFNNCINPINNLPNLSLSKTWPDEYICTVGRPCYQKNIDFMIQVFNEVLKEKQTHLVIMGVGHHADQLDLVENLIEELNLTNHVTLLKWTSREDVLSIINKSQLYISTARYEGLPYSIIESLALSKPCVVSDCDGNRDLILDEYNGYVIQDYDLNLFKEKILQLLNDRELHQVFSVNAKHHFNQNFNIKTNIADLENIYSKFSIN
jgi:glycosyltransferase involved in cell wall biosynthesis